MPYHNRLKPQASSFIQPSSIQYLLCATLITFANHTWALPEDSQQPINIQSDRAAQKVLKDGSERTEYSGKVVMTQGSMKINGEHVTIHSKDRKVVRIVAVGKPARFQQQSDPSKSPMKAKAENIRYQLSKDTIVLANGAQIKQDGNVVSGERIEYNIASEKVNATRGADSSTRVHVVLEPMGKESSE